MKQLLVIDYNASTDWYSKFRGKTLSSTGEGITVEQAGWEDIVLIGNSERGGPVIFLKASKDNTLKQQQKDREICPDFLLIRNFPCTFVLRLRLTYIV